MTNHTLSHKKASPAGSFFFALIYPDATESLVMEGVMHYAFSHYPAADGNYGLVLWGHGSGWLMDNEVKRVNSRAFGVDKGEDGRALWMNIPTMANILKGMPHLKFRLIHYYHTDDDSDFHPEVQRLHGDRREDARCVDVRRAESGQGKLRKI